MAAKTSTTASVAAITETSTTRLTSGRPDSITTRAVGRDDAVAVHKALRSCDGHGGQRRPRRRQEYDREHRKEREDRDECGGGEQSHGRIVAAIATRSIGDSPASGVLDQKRVPTEDEDGADQGRHHERPAGYVCARRLKVA